MTNEGELNYSQQKLRRDIVEVIKITNEKVVVFVTFISFSLLKTVVLFQNGENCGIYDWLGRALPKKCAFDSFLFGAEFPITKENLTKHQWQIEFTIL